MPMRARLLTVTAIAAAAAIGACKNGSDPTGPDSLFTEVVVTPSTGNVTVGNTIQLSAAVSGPPGTPQGVRWKSVDTAFASVNTTGLVTAKAAGSARIRAMWLEDTTNFTDAFINITDTPVMEEDPSRGATRRGSKAAVFKRD